MAGLARTCVSAFALSAGALVACGHLPFDEIPVSEPNGNATTVEGGTDPGKLVDGSVDGAPPIRDAGPDADPPPCSGTTCIGTFVSESVGDDKNPGTALEPVRTIKKGIEFAKALGGKQQVFVGAGHYPEKVTLENDVDLLGGYECSANGACTWKRDPELFDTAILDQDIEGVIAGSDITRGTLFDGFRVQGHDSGSATGSVAFSIVGGSPSIAHCQLFGGTVTGATRRSIALGIFGAPSTTNGPTIKSSHIEGGPADEISIGIVLEGKPGVLGAPTATIAGNTIRSGPASLSQAIAAPTSALGTLVSDNDITAGTSTGGGSAPGVWGISVGGLVTIDRNRINAPGSDVGSCSSTVKFCGGIQSLGSSAVITNNVVYGVSGPKTCAVLLRNGEGGIVNPVTVNGNTLDGGGQVVSEAGMVSTAIALSVEGTTTGIGKLRNNILLGGINVDRFGVYEEAPAGKTVHPTVIDYSDFWNVALENHNNWAYRSWDGTTGTKLTFDQLPTVTPTWPNLFNVDPNFVDAARHIDSGSECVNAGTSTEAPTTDMDGQLRPTDAIDIGADEVE